MRELFRSVGGDIGDRDAVALFGELSTDGPTDSATAAGDESDSRVLHFFALLFARENRLAVVGEVRGPLLVERFDSFASLVGLDEQIESVESQAADSGD